MATSNNDEENFYSFERSDLTMFTGGSVSTINSSQDRINSTNTNESDRLNNEIEAHERHEFIRLIQEGKKTTLAEGKSFSSQWENYKKGASMTRGQSNITTETYNFNDNVFVISFLGDTTVGKSFLANQLLNVDTYVSENEHCGSTTANVTCFESNDSRSKKENTSCLVLDFEGENGSRLPRLLRRLLNYAFPSEEEKEATLRRDAVKLYFPPLAYLLSNVIILTGHDNLFHNSRYIDRIKEFTAQATDSVQQNMHKPILILVQNKYPGEDILSPMEATKKFYQTNPDASNLNKFFSNIRCIILPFTHKKNNNIEKKFDEQVAALRKLLSVIREQFQSSLLPHFAWLQLSQKIIRNLSDGKTVMMHLLLEDVFMKKHGNSENIIIMFFFRRLYEKNNICSTRWFHYCRDFVMDVLARSTALRFPQFQCEKMEPLIENECKIRLNDLWKLLDEYRPCEALYMKQGYTKNRDHPVFCYQYKGKNGAAHEHQTSEVVLGASWFKKLIERLGIERPTIDKWDGSFESSDDTSNSPGDNMHQKLLRTTRIYLNELKNKPKGIYMTFNQMKRKWNLDIEYEQYSQMDACVCCFEPITNNNQTQAIQFSLFCSTCDVELHSCEQDDPVENNVPPSLRAEENQCVICMSSPRTVMFSPCNHYRYCEPCAEKIFSRFKICSLCKQPVKNIQPVH